MKKKSIVLILVLILIATLPLQAFARRPNSDPLYYLNMGDSIAAGMSAYPGEDYFEYYSEYLSGFGVEKVPEWYCPDWYWFIGWYKAYGKYEDGNIAMPGMTTGCMLGMLAFVEPAQEMVKDADIITISIGGNNVLQPMIGAMMEVYGAMFNTSIESVEELLQYIEWGGEDTWDMIAHEFIAMMMPRDPECPLWQGVAQFNREWPEILGMIHSLNPEAHVIALSIYNPVSRSESPELYMLMEEMIHSMNLTMRRHQSNRVSVANVHQSFRRNDDAVNFSVEWFPYLDPHPTNYGHQLIGEELMRVRNPRAFR